MALTPGSRLGVYEVAAQIGEGGMGQVYRARDTKLDRDVAIKILPEAFAHDADRLARLTREAKTLASLNHPNIAAIYGLEESGGVTALVMELVEGEDLSALIARGPVSLSDALPVARQIADALEAAHEQGVIHRDLKPANVKVRADGTVKVLDFGLAKALEPAGVNAAASASMSPTITSPAMTQIGMILGTAAYMAPEQARGKTVDRRADIWAFGCVLYEMLTGRKAFEGETLPDVMAAIMRAEPDWTRLPAATPVAVRRVLTRCLSKDVKKRLRDAGDAKLDLELSDPTPVGTPPRTALRHLPARQAWLAIAILGTACVAVTVLWWRNAVPAPIHWTASSVGGPRIAFQPRVSPDGRTLAFLSLTDGQAQVGVINPDSGDWSLLTRDFSRGPVVHLAWSSDGARILFDRRRSRGGNIWSVPALGGEPRLVIENGFGPEPLPDGSLLFLRVTREGRAVVHRFWPESGEVRMFAAEVFESFVTSLRAFADGREVALFGRPANAPHDTPNQLYVMDVDSGALRLIAPGVRFSEGIYGRPVGVSADGTDVLIVRQNGDASEVMAIPRTGARDVRVLLSTPGLIAGVTEASGGRLYIDQVDRSTEHVRFGLRDVTPEVLGVGLNVSTGSLPLLDGRFVYPARVGGRHRLFAGRPGAERVLFAGTTDEANGPMTRLNDAEFAYVGGTADQSMITIASAEDGRLIRRLEGSRGRAVSRLAVSADRHTIYFIAGSRAWSISAAGGDAREFAAASGIAVDPRGRFVLLQREDEGGLRLVRRAGNGTETDVALPAGFSLVRNSLWPTALRADGRLALVVERVHSWFWHPVVLQLGTGVVTTLPFQYAGDVDSDVSWDDERITALTRRMEGALWRFEPRADVLASATD